MTVTDLAPIPICNSQKRPFVKILIISDAWHPLVNGVVRTLESTAKELARLGHETRIVGPDAARWLTFAAPSYPEIKLRRLKNEVHQRYGFAGGALWGGNTSS
jgi:hypothetical protein